MLPVDLMLSPMNGGFDTLGESEGSRSPGILPRVDPTYGESQIKSQLLAGHSLCCRWELAERTINNP